MEELENMVFVLIGAPCSGKSYIGTRLAEMLKIPYYSSGDIARNMGELVRNDLNNGKPAPEERMREEILKILQSNKSFVLDGFPRFIDQMDWLHSNYSGDIMYLVVDCSINELARRNSGRGRDDMDSFSERIRWYVSNTIPLIDKIYKDNLPVVACTSQFSASRLVVHILEVLYAKNS